MKTLELSDEEEAVLAVELVQLVSQAEYPFSDRVRTLGAILNKLASDRAQEPLPPPTRRSLNQFALPLALNALGQGRARPHIGGMHHLELTDEQAAVLTRELTDITQNGRYPLSPRVQTRKAILAKLRPEPRVYSRSRQSRRRQEASMPTVEENKRGFERMAQVKVLLYTNGLSKRRQTMDGAGRRRERQRQLAFEAEQRKVATGSYIARSTVKVGRNTLMAAWISAGVSILTAILTCLFWLFPHT